MSIFGAILKALGYVGPTLKSVKSVNDCHRLFERIARDEQDHARIVWSLAVQYDIKPSVARGLFERYRQENPCDDFRLCGRMLMTSIGGIRWMSEQVALGEALKEDE